MLIAHKLTWESSPPMSNLVLEPAWCLSQAHEEILTSSFDDLDDPDYVSMTNIPNMEVMYDIL